MPKLWIISDIHNETGRDIRIRLPVPACDALVIAGDYHRAALAIKFARDQAEDLPLIMVAGNHEHYKTGRTVAQDLSEMRRHAAEDRARGNQTYFLEDEAVELDLTGQRVRFIGSTLWTDFGIFGDTDVSIAYAKRAMNDFVYIRSEESLDGTLTPNETISWHQKSRAFIQDQLQLSAKTKTVVVTHHLPSIRSVASKYLNNPLTPAFASNCDDLLSLGADLWVHGHTHSSAEYHERSTRVICNPQGYPIGLGRAENPQFDPALVINI